MKELPPIIDHLIDDKDSPIIVHTLIYPGHLTKEELKETEHEGRQIIHQFSGFNGHEPETVIIFQAVRPAVTVSTALPELEVLELHAE